MNSDLTFLDEQAAIRLQQLNPKILEEAKKIFHLQEARKQVPVLKLRFNDPSYDRKKLYQECMVTMAHLAYGLSSE